jgi:hypothetical protein
MHFWYLNRFLYYSLLSIILSLKQLFVSIVCCILLIQKPDINFHWDYVQKFKNIYYKKFDFGGTNLIWLLFTKKKLTERNERNKNFKEIEKFLWKKIPFFKGNELCYLFVCRLKTDWMNTEVYTSHKRIKRRKNNVYQFHFPLIPIFNSSFLFHYWFSSSIHAYLFIFPFFFTLLFLHKL